MGLAGVFCGWLVLIGVLYIWAIEAAKNRESYYTQRYFGFLLLGALLLVLVLISVDLELNHARLTLYRAQAGYDIDAKDRINAIESLEISNDLEAISLSGRMTPTPEPKPLNQPWRK